MASDQHLTASLAALAAASAAAAVDPSDGELPPGAVVLADRPDGTVVRVGDTVAKAHAADTDTTALTTRLAIAAHPLLHGILLPPLPAPGGPPAAPPVPAAAPAAPPPAPGPTPFPAPRGAPAATRPVTLWPYGSPVDRDTPAAAPWAAAGELLARLHAVPWPRLSPAVPGPLPAMRGPAKAARAMSRLLAAPGGAADSGAARAVRRAWERLPGWARGEEPYEGPGALCHGDLHLGQLVRHPAPDGRWLLIDIDDLGAGAPAWDLARPAMWFAAGLLDPAAWSTFLAAYRAAGGVAVPPWGDPWPALDVAARALAVQTAALALAKAAREARELDEAESQLVAACGRIAQLE